MAQLNNNFILVVLLVMVLMVGVFAMQQTTAQLSITGIPKVDIVATEHNNAILIKWKNPLDVTDNVMYNYQVLRKINDGRFQTIFDSSRNLNEKIIDKDRKESFFYLDTDIKKGITYTYQIATTDSKKLDIIRSNISNSILLNPREQQTQIESHGHLITGRDITPITPTRVIWFDWFDMQEANADTFVNDIFTTTLNPFDESYRMALEPMPKAENASKNCDQALEFEYSKNNVRGQDMKIVVSIFETEFARDDNPPSTTETLVLKHQKTFNDFSDSIKVKNKWFAIHPENQVIFNFTKLEVQFDITADATPDPNEYRSITIWDVLFIVPEGNQC